MVLGLDYDPVLEQLGTVTFLLVSLKVGHGWDTLWRRSGEAQPSEATGTKEAVRKRADCSFCVIVSVRLYGVGVSYACMD